VTESVVTASAQRQYEASRPASDRGGTPRSSTLVLVLRALPWTVVATALVAALLWTGAPAHSILRHGVYWVAGVVVPGTLTFRALRGSRGNLPEDVGRVWWSGPVAAFAAVAVPGASIWPAYVAGTLSALPPNSPTLVFSIPAMAAVILLLVDVARASRSAGPGCWSRRC
jgi:hypothetical protein